MQQQFSYSELLSEKESLECELEIVQKDCEVRENEIAKLKKRITSFQSELDNTVSFDEHKQLQQELNQQIKRNEELRKNLNDFKQHIKFRDESQNELTDNLNKLQKELEQEKMEKKSMRADLESLAKEFLKEQNELEELKQQSQHSSKLIESLKEENENLNRFVENVRESQKQNISEISHFSERSFETLDVVVEIKLRETEEKLAESERCVEMLRERAQTLAEAEQCVLTLQEQIQVLETEKISLKEEKTSLEIEIEKQKEEITMLNETSNQEISRLYLMCENLKEDFGKTSALTENLQKEVLAMESKLELAKNNLLVVQTEQQEKNAQSQQEINSLNETLQQKNQLVETLNLEKNQLHQSITSMQQECQTQLEVSKNVQELADSQRVQLIKLEKEKQELIEKSQVLSGQVQHDKKRIQNLEKERTNLESQLNGTQDQLADLKSKQKEERISAISKIDALTLKLQDEQKRSSTFEKLYWETESKIKKINEVMEQLQAERETRKAEFAYILNENMELRKEKEKLQSERINEIKSNIGKVLNQKCKECDKLLKEVTAVKTKLSQIQKSQDDTLHEYRVQIGQYKAKLNEKNRHVYDSEQTLKNLKWCLKQKDSQIQRLQTDLKCSQDTVMMEKTCNNKIYNEYRQACGQPSSLNMMEQSFNQISYSRENDSIHFRKADEPSEVMDANRLTNPSTKYKMEDEQNRIKTLQNRNALVLPHLKSTYALEFQDAKPNKAFDLFTVNEQPNIRKRAVSNIDSASGSISSIKNTHTTGFWPNKKR